MEQIGTTISNFIREQFPAHYREHGPLLVSFVEQYFEWLESKTIARDDYVNPRFSSVKTVINSANVIGTGTLFTTHFEKGDQIVINKDEQTDDFTFFRIKSVANNTFITLTAEKVPDFSVDKAKYATVSEKPNALFLTRNFFTINDVDNTFDEYVVYFKEKFLKGLQFKTTTDTKTLIKHSLDLYRSKGTERSVDLLYKIVFGKPASVYYPGRDLFKLSSGDWYIPNYLELSLSPANKLLINRQVVGTISGATAFVEEIIRRIVNSKVVEVAYISAINGVFITGEKVILADNSLDMADAPTIVGSLNEIQVDILGTGTGFELNETVDITSTYGVGGKAKVTSVSNTVGQVFFTLDDGGYGYANTIQVSNTTGNVSAETGNSIIVGDGTLFETEYSNGDYISIWSNSITYATHKIIEIASNTELTIDATLSFTNTETKAAFTRYFAQTFISEYILELSNVTIQSTYNNFEYFHFLDRLTEPLALINYENANGNFAAGDTIYTYDGNNDVIGTAKILVTRKVTQTSGVLTIAPLSGDLEETAIYTTANAIGANLAIANGYVDITATANVIGTYANVIVTCNNSSGNFVVGEDIIQLSSGAHGTLRAVFSQGSNVVMNLIDTTGIFKSGFEVEEEVLLVAGSESGETANVIAVDIFVGVVATNNAFLTYEGNWVHTPYMQGHVESVSRGSGADVTFANTLLFSEEITYNTDFVNPYLTYELADTWPFPAEPNSNLDTIIADSLTWANINIGKISAIISSTPGTDYNMVPVIRLHEPTIFRYGIGDTITLQLTSTTGLDVGEILEQANTSARGVVKAIDDPFVTIQTMRFYANNGFVVTTSVATQTISSGSGTVSNVVAITPRLGAPRYGSDITTDKTLVIGAGAITGLQVLDSGFGFVNGEIVTITGGLNTANGFAVDMTHGTGSGYYKSRDGFLSDTKMLSDGFYWQEYSYEVRSGVVSEFKSILKSVIHVAGTGYFDKLVFDSINTTTPEIESIITQTVTSPLDKLIFTETINSQYIVLLEDI